MSSLRNKEFLLKVECFDGEDSSSQAERLTKALSDIVELKPGNKI